VLYRHCALWSCSVTVFRDRALSLCFMIVLCSKITRLSCTSLFINISIYTVHVAFVFPVASANLCMNPGFFTLNRTEKLETESKGLVGVQHAPQWRAQKWALVIESTSSKNIFKSWNTGFKEPRWTSPIVDSLPVLRWIWHNQSWDEHGGRFLVFHILRSEAVNQIALLQ